MSFFGTISSKEHNGLRLMIALAENYNSKKTVSLSDISKKEGISVKYLEQLIIPFKKAGLIVSERGRSGGYILSKDPKKISLKNIIDLLNDHPKLAICLDDNYDHSCEFDKNCTSKSVWKKIQKNLDTQLNKILLSDILKY